VTLLSPVVARWVEPGPFPVGGLQAPVSAGRLLTRTLLSPRRQRVRDRVSLGLGRTPQSCLGGPTLAAANIERAVKQDDARSSRPVGDLRRSSRPRAPGAGVNHRTLPVASPAGEWLPRPYGIANLLYVRNCVLVGGEQDANMEPRELPGRIAADLSQAQLRQKPARSGPKGPRGLFGRHSALAPLPSARTGIGPRAAA
jgi:hypothetical protein